jgi:hypothetical protein
MQARVAPQLGEIRLIKAACMYCGQLKFGADIAFSQFGFTPET